MCKEREREDGLILKIAEAIVERHGDTTKPVPADVVASVIASFDDDIFDAVARVLEEVYHLEVS